MPPVLPEECHEHLRNGNYHNCGIPVARLLRVVRGLLGAANGCHRLGAVGDFLPLRRLAWLRAHSQKPGAALRIADL